MNFLGFFLGQSQGEATQGRGYKGTSQKFSCPTYTLPRNQYVNNSPGIFSCIREDANTGAACIRTEWIPLTIWQNTREIPPQKYFPVFARVRIQAPHVFAQKLIPQEFFPACIGFVPGGIHQNKAKMDFQEGTKPLRGSPVPFPEG